MRKTIQNSEMLPAAIILSMTISVRYLPRTNELEFAWHGSRSDLPSGHGKKELLAVPMTTITEAWNKITTQVDYLTIKDGYSKAELRKAMGKIERIGEGVLGALIPRELSNDIVGLQTNKKVLFLLIQEKGVFVPWEILFHSKTEMFWGLSFPIVRLPQSRPSSIKPPVGTIWNVHHKALENEVIRDLERLFQGISRNVRRVEGPKTSRLKSMLRSSGIVHMTCHGEPGDVFGPQMKFGEGPDQVLGFVDLEVLRNKGGAKSKLVFLNACYGGKVFICYTNQASFASKLVDSGVAAVISAPVALPDLFVTRFSREFYEKYLGNGGREPAVALFESKIRYMEKQVVKNPFWLFYTCNGHGDVR